MSEELEILQRRVEEAMFEVDAKAEIKKSHVKAAAQEEDLLQAELDAVREIFARLEPMSPSARDRVVSHVISFFSELEKRERRDYENLAAPMPPEGYVMQPSAMNAMEARRR